MTYAAVLAAVMLLAWVASRSSGGSQPAPPKPSDVDRWTAEACRQLADGLTSSQAAAVLAKAQYPAYRWPPPPGSARWRQDVWVSVLAVTEYARTSDVCKGVQPAPAPDDKPPAPDDKPPAPAGVVLTPRADAATLRAKGGYVQVQWGDNLTDLAKLYGSPKPTLGLMQLINASPRNSMVLVPTTDDYTRNRIGPLVVSFFTDWMANPTSDSERGLPGNAYPVVWLPPIG